MDRCGLSSMRAVFWRAAKGQARFFLLDADCSGGGERLNHCDGMELSGIGRVARDWLGNRIEIHSRIFPFVAVAGDHRVHDSELPVSIAFAEEHTHRNRVCGVDRDWRGGHGDSRYSPFPGTAGHGSNDLYFPDYRRRGGFETYLTGVG